MNLFKFKNFFWVLFLIGFFSENLFCSAEFYPTELSESIRQVNKNPTVSNIENTYNLFLKYKGISDKIIVYSIVEALLEHKISPEQRVLSILKDISHEHAPKIEAVFEKNKLKKLFMFVHFLDRYSMYKIFRYVAVVFLSLLFLYLFIKNHYIFLHSHSDYSKVLNYLKAGIFLMIVLFLALYFRGFAELMLTCGIVVLLIPESRFSAVIISVLLFLFLIPSFIVPKYSKNSDYLMYRLSVSPVSLKYLEELENSKKSAIISLIKNIKYGLIQDNVSKSYLSNIGITNMGILYLMKGDYKKFDEISKKYHLMDNPVVVMNLTSYFAKTYQYQNYESFLNVLYQNYPSLYKIFQNYQSVNKEQTFYPYFPETKEFTLWFEMNYLKLLVSFCVLLVFLGVSYKISAFKPFQCGSCGENFCIKCNDGYLYENICENCRSLKKKISQANASILLKKSIQSDRFAYKKSVMNVLLSIFLPGSNFFTTNSIIVGLFVTLTFSIFLVFILFNWSLFVHPDNLGFHLVVRYLFYACGVFFGFVYILSIIFGRKG